MEQSHITIEEAHDYSQELHDGLIHLSSQLGDSQEELTKEDVMNLLTNPLLHLFVSINRQSQEIVGMLTLVTYRTPYKLNGRFEELVVDSASRGQKVGEKLLEAGITKAREVGLTSIFLNSNPSREAANRLYQKLGFERYETNVYKVQL